MTIQCNQCHNPINGETFVEKGEIIHPKCLKAYRNAKLGRLYPCPKCRTSGEINHPTATVTVEEKFMTPQPFWGDGYSSYTLTVQISPFSSSLVRKSPGSKGEVSRKIQ